MLKGMPGWHSWALALACWACLGAGRLGRGADSVLSLVQVSVASAGPEGNLAAVAAAEADEELLDDDEGELPGGTVLVWRRAPEPEPGESLNFARAATHTRPYVVVNIFSGRRSCEEINLRYVRRLVERGEIDEVHINVNGRRTGGRDRDWLKGLADEHNKTSVHEMPYDTEIYAFYAETWRPPRGREEDCIIIKCDDDIVYWDIDHFGNFTKYVLEHPEKFMVFANTINNGVAAYYQMQHGAIPTNSSGLNMSMEYPSEGYGGSLWKSSPKCTELHRIFLENPARFSWHDTASDGCIVYHPPNVTQQKRFSINFFGWRFERSKEISRQAGKADEASLTTRNTNNTLCMHTEFVVAHLAFYPQSKAAQTALPWYEARARELLG